MNLRVDHVRLPSGAEMEEFHVVEYPDWVAVLCFTDAGEVVLVEQYRHGIEQISFELPAGAIDADESAADAAKRELREETGYVSDDWHYVGRCAPEPSKHTNWAYVYVARGARLEEAPSLDETEHLNVHLRAPEDLMKMIHAGLFVHGPQLAGVLLAREKGFFPAEAVTAPDVAERPVRQTPQQPH